MDASGSQNPTLSTDGDRLGLAYIRSAIAASSSSNINNATSSSSSSSSSAAAYAPSGSIGGIHYGLPPAPPSSTNGVHQQYLALSTGHASSGGVVGSAAQVPPIATTSSSFSPRISAYPSEAIPWSTFTRSLKVKHEDVSLLQAMYPEGWSRAVAYQFVTRRVQDVTTAPSPRRRPSWKEVAAQLGDGRPAALLCDRFNKVIRPLLCAAADAAAAASSSPSSQSTTSSWSAPQSEPRGPGAWGVATDAVPLVQDTPQWTPDKDMLLMEAYRRFEHSGRSGGPDWSCIAVALRAPAAPVASVQNTGEKGVAEPPFRPSPKQCAIRFRAYLMPKLGGAKFHEKWTASEDEMLLLAFEQFKQSASLKRPNWSKISQALGGSKSPKQCEKRYTSCLLPKILDPGRKGGGSYLRDLLVLDIWSHEDDVSLYNLVTGMMTTSDSIGAKCYVPAWDDVAANPSLGGRHTPAQCVVRWIRLQSQLNHQHNDPYAQSREALQSYIDTSSSSGELPTHHASGDDQRVTNSVPLSHSKRRRVSEGAGVSGPGAALVGGGAAALDLNLIENSSAGGTWTIDEIRELLRAFDVHRRDGPGGRPSWKRVAETLAASQSARAQSAVSKASGPDRQETSESARSSGGVSHAAADRVAPPKTADECKRRYYWFVERFGSVAENIGAPPSSSATPSSSSPSTTPVAVASDPNTSSDEGTAVAASSAASTATPAVSSTLPVLLTAAAAVLQDRTIDNTPPVNTVTNESMYIHTYPTYAITSEPTIIARAPLTCSSSMASNASAAAGGGAYGVPGSFRVLGAAGDVSRFL